MDLQNPPLVRCLLSLGANVNCFNYGGFTPYHLTYGRQSEEIRCELYGKTAQELRALPDSESDESDVEEANASDDEVPASFRATVNSDRAVGVTRLSDLFPLPPRSRTTTLSLGSRRRSRPLLVVRTGREAAKGLPSNGPT